MNKLILKGTISEVIEYIHSLRKLGYLYVGSISLQEKK